MQSLWPNNRLHIPAMISWIVLASAVGVTGAPPGTGSAPVQPTPPAELSPSEAAEAERQLTAQELNKARAAIEAARANGGEPPANLQAVLDALNNIELSCGQVLAALDQQNELKQSRAQVTADLEALRAQGVTDPKPYAFMMLEALRDQFEAESQRATPLEDALSTTAAALDAAKGTLEDKQRARRQAREALETNTDDGRAPTLRHALRMAELACRLSLQKVNLRQIELANQRVEIEVHELRLEFLREKLAAVEPHVRFSNDELRDILTQLDQTEYSLARSLEEAEADFPILSDHWQTARAALDATSTAGPELVEEVEARRLARLARQREIALVGQQQQIVAGLKTLWTRRHEAHVRRIERSLLKEREEEAAQVIAQLERDLRLHGTRLDEMRAELRAVETKLGSVQQSNPEAARWVEDQRAQLGKLIELFEATVSREQHALRLYKRYLADVGAQARIVTWGQRLHGIWRVVVDVWNYELTSVQDNPITVKKIVTGALLLVLGALGAKVASRLFAQRFLPRFGLNEGALAAIQSLLFYLLLLTVVMLSLRLVNVPLTAFTILGGALAIGVGFGSQNIVNNFISGLIMLAERPIRVGDLIEIEDLVGTVAHIGPRSTRVRSPENMDIVVPNSSFLEKNVINWTLSDDQHRAHITVGVVYGSPTREVGKLIRRALDEHGKILTKPEPIVLFSDFGDNALIFEVHFWVRMRRIMERRIIESDLRYRIDTLFREAGIVIAFPQRDVHLDTVSPLTVQLLNPVQSSPTDEDPAPEAGDTGHA